MQNGAPQPPPPPPIVTAAAPEDPLTTDAEDDDLTFDLADTLTKAALSVLDNVLALL
jgi:hypothetical protein